MRVSEILLVVKALFLSRIDKTVLAARLEREREIMNVVAVLPGRYTCKQVERALKAAKATPEMISLCLATGEHTYVLEWFYAALQREVSTDEMSKDWREEEWW